MNGEWRMEGERKYKIVGGTSVGGCRESRPQKTYDDVTMYNIVNSNKKLTAAAGKGRRKNEGREMMKCFQIHHHKNIKATNANGRREWKK
jgi:hypothetical protein